MKNLYLLQTEKPSRLFIDNGILELDTECIISEDWWIKNQNIYITSSEEIKEGDWLIVNDEDVMQMKSSYDNDMSGEDIWVGDSLNGYATYKDNCKKIILTTDQNLINDGVQAIDDEFLEWFVKNPSCESVEVQNQYRVKSGTIQEHKDGLAGYEYYEYKIIIPKEEPKQEPLEEAAKDYIENTMKFSFNSLETKTQANRMLKCIEFGAKWQQERMYSEEEMDEFAEFSIRCSETYEKFIELGSEYQAERMYSEEDMRKAFIAGGNSCIEEDDAYGSAYKKYMEEWFKQFKKK
jgi:hypothetical protein